MARAYGEVVVVDRYGNALPGVAVDILDPVTSVRIPETVYVDGSSVTTITLPTVTDSAGKLPFYLAAGRIVKARATVNALTYDDVIAVDDPTVSAPTENMAALSGGGETNYSRMLVNQNSIQMVSGVILFGPANVALITETIGNISCLTGGTAASGTTFAGYAVYSVDAVGNLTRVAQTNNNTSLWNSSFQGLNGFSVKQALASPLAKVAGVTYSVAALHVGTVSPTIGGETPSTGESATNLLPPMRGAKSAGGQTSFPATVAVGALVANGYAPFFALLP